MMHASDHRHLYGSATCDRQAAARFLRLARCGEPLDALEAVAWARCAMPTSVAAIRLEVQLLREHSDDAAADAVLEQGLLLAPNHAGLLRLKAQSMFERGAHAAADDLIRKLLARRPNHLDTRLLAARTALARGDVNRAIEHLRHMIDVSMGTCESARRLLAEILLENHRIDEAREHIWCLCERDTLLESRLLRAEDRFHDAADMLEAAVRRGGIECESQDALMHELIDLLDAMADGARLRPVLDDLSPAAPRSFVRGLEALLGRGEFERVVELTDAANDGHLMREHVRMARLIALVLLDRHDESREVLAAVDPNEIDFATRARWWRRAWCARWLRGEPGELNLLPIVSPLGAMIDDAIRSLESAEVRDQERAGHVSLLRMFTDRGAVAHGRSDDAVIARVDADAAQDAELRKAA